MVRPDLAKWNQTLEDVRRLSVEATHQRTRERFQAIIQIASGKTNATTWANQISRRVQTVLGWLHTYNEQGPEALLYKRTGGRRPLFLLTTKTNSCKPPTKPNPLTTACPDTARRSRSSELGSDKLSA